MLERAVVAFAREPNGGLIVTPSAQARRFPRPDHHTGGPPPLANGFFRPFGGNEQFTVFSTVSIF
jgi:hypothetical protein